MAGRRTAGAPGWWRTWRARFGLAEVCGTLAAVAGFAAGYLPAGSLLAAAALATICEAVGFYGCIGVKTVAAARQATAHLGGWRRLTAGAWHAVREQLASCAAAEAVDSFPDPSRLPGRRRVAAAAAARRGVARVPGGQGRRRRGLVWPRGVRPAGRGLVRRHRETPAKPATPYMSLDLARATGRYRELAVALPGVAVHYAVKANPDPRLLARLHAAGCRFEAASWAEVRAAVRAGAGAGTVLYTNPVKPAAISPAPGGPGCGGSPRTPAPNCTRSPRVPRGRGAVPAGSVFGRRAGGTVGDQGKFGAPSGQVPGLARLAASLGLTPYGLAFHVGSQMMDPAAWDGPIRQCARIMTELAADGIRLEMLDLGGGFPVRYDADPPPLAEYAAVISRAAAQLPYPVQLACEPGRAIAAPAGTMVASVIGVAWRHGTVRVSLDTGAFHGLIEALESGRELRFPVTIPAPAAACWSRAR